AAGLLDRFHNMYFYTLWRLGHAHQRIVAEVALLDLAILERYRKIHRGGNAIERATHHLRLDTERIDDASDVDRAHGAMDFQFAACHRNLERMRGIAAEREVAGDAEAVTVAALVL